VNAGQALAIFIGIPVGFAVLVVIAVSAPNWMRGDRHSGLPGEPTAEGPVFISSSGSAPDPSIVPRELGVGSYSVVGGGAHGSF
jgi:hypothetical protein